MPKIKDVDVNGIAEFFLKEFEGTDAESIANFERDMPHYARVAKYLALADIQNPALKFVEVVLSFYMNDSIKGGFFIALGSAARHFGFNPTVSVLSGSVGDASLRYVVGNRSLFRDLVTPDHGEFTHALQWMMLVAQQRNDPGNSLEGIDIPSLYQRSFSYRSKRVYKLDKKDQFGKTRFPKKNIFIWQLIVDCFPGDDEDYERNARSRDLRCPQVFSWRMNMLDNLTAKSFLPSFLKKRYQKRKDQGIDNLRVAGEQIDKKMGESNSPYIADPREHSGVYFKRPEYNIRPKSRNRNTNPV